MNFFDAARPALIATLWALPACSTDPGTSEGSESSESSENSGENESESSGETGQAGFFEGELEFITYESQPMVVDVVVQTTVDASAAEWEWAHASDPGVRFAALDTGTPTEHHFRIRGLAPETAHSVTLQVTHEGMAHDAEGEFTALTALPGFEAEVAVEGTSLNPDTLRLFDWSTLNPQPVGLMQVDSSGQTRWYWGEALDGGFPVVEGLKLLDDGSVIYGLGDSIYQRDELGQIQRQIDAADLDVGTFHHEVLVLPNGNILTMSFEFMVENYGAEGDFLIAGDYLMEIDPQGELVWTWSSFEHLDTQRVRPGFHALFPAIIDPDSGEQAKDWSHANAFTYDAEQDTILLSLRHQDWLVAIDHETGDVQWKLGPEGDFDLLDGTWFYHQHSPEWQPDGSLLLYDNGLTNPDIDPDAWRSRAVRYELDYDAMTATQAWEDDIDPVQSPAMGDADLMPGGEFLVTDATLGLNIDMSTAHARVREMDPQASPQTQWSFDAPEGRVIFRAMPTQRLVGELPAD